MGACEFNDSWISVKSNNNVGDWTIIERVADEPNDEIDRILVEVNLLESELPHNSL